MRLKSFNLTLGSQIFKACADESRNNHFVFYGMKDEVAEIINQIFAFLRKDQQLQKDQQVYQTLFSNRELAVNKVNIQAWRKIAS